MVHSTGVTKTQPPALGTSLSLPLPSVFLCACIYPSIYVCVCACARACVRACVNVLKGLCVCLPHLFLDAVTLTCSIMYTALLAVMVMGMVTTYVSDKGMLAVKVKVPMAKCVTSTVRRQVIQNLPKELFTKKWHTQKQCK